MNFFPYATASRFARTGAVLAITAALAGCGKEEPKVYSVIKETAAPAATPMPHGAAGPGNATDPHGAIAGTTPRVTYEVPPGWQEQPASQMRAASFTVQGAEGKFVEIAVIPLPALGGKETDMVNIWRGQLHLTPATEDELAKSGEAVDIGEVKGRLFDLASTELLVDGKYKARIVVATLPLGDVTWFFKMAGEESLAAAQTPSFKSFLKSIGFAAPTAAPPVAAGGIAPMAGGAGMPPMGGAMPRLPDTGPSPAKPEWTVPAGWTEQPPSQMLVAKFVATNAEARAEITVSSFPGDVGGVPANVNRWRRQIGLDQLPETEAVKAVTQIDPTPGKLMLVELSGTDARTGKPARLVGVIAPQADVTWFYKLLGDEKVVAGEKDALVKFARSVKYSHAP